MRSSLAQAIGQQLDPTRSPREAVLGRQAVTENKQHRAATPLVRGFRTPRHDRREACDQRDQ